MPRKILSRAIELSCLTKADNLSLRFCDLNFWDKRVLDYHIIISVSKKISKLATVRNKIKRRIRAAFSEMLKANSAKPGMYLIHAKPGVQVVKYQDILTQLKSILMN